MDTAHEVSADLMLEFVGTHIAAVIFSSWRHSENLIGAMISGRKVGPPEAALGRAWPVWPC